MADDWQPAETAPRDGSRFDVRREGCSYEGTSAWDEAHRRWVTSILFVSNGFASAVFTHWRPSVPGSATDAAKAGDVQS